MRLETKKSMEKVKICTLQRDFPGLIFCSASRKEAARLKYSLGTSWTKFSLEKLDGCCFLYLKLQFSEMLDLLITNIFQVH